MNLVQIDDGRYADADWFSFLKRQPGGEWRVRWKDGGSEVLSSTDGDAIVQALTKPQRKTTKKPQTN